MSGLRNPVGDEPPETYWRRRLITIGVVVLAILLLWFLISATLAGDGEGASSKPDSSPGATVSPDPKAPADAGDADRPCTAEDLAITTAASPAKPAVGSSVAFDVTVEHKGGSACALSSAGEGTSVTVGSGKDDVYYNSAWCKDSPVFEEASWILQPGDRQALQATWNLQRYNNACEPGSGGKAGTYWVDVAVSGIKAEQARFELVG